MESVNLNREELLSLFLPNSYEMYWNISAAEFCQRMQRENDLFWNESRESKRKRLNMSRNEVITLAAIVNEESRKVDERPRVAGVYLNRLRRGMKLQADPTCGPAYDMTPIKLYDNFTRERTLFKPLFC